MKPSLINLKDFGLKDTQPRRMVLNMLYRTRVPASVQMIQKKILSTDQTINAVTIYRILDVFEKLHIVHRHPCNGCYSLCTLPDKKGHHGFLHCRSCDGIEEFASDDVCRVEHGIAKKSGFTPDAHVSEILGVCTSCS